jgi:hypothetical protein
LRRHTSRGDTIGTQQEVDMADKAKPTAKKAAPKASIKDLRVSKKDADKVKGGLIAGPPEL